MGLSVFMLDCNREMKLLKLKANYNLLPFPSITQVIL